jgi:N-methylhydantoinase B
MGDIYAQLAANRTGEGRFVEMLDRFGEDTVLAAARDLQDYSERLARDAIRAIPDGIYRAEDFVDDNGFTPEPLRVAVKITVDGDEIEIDFDGSSPQTKGMINSPHASTVSAAYGAIAILLGGGRIPVNDGLYRPIRRVQVPFGSFLNPSQPLAVRARNNACHRVYNSIMLAMSEVVPAQVLTSGHDTTNAIGMGHMGRDRYRVYMEVVGGGWGASAGSDGADVVDGYVGNCSNVPVESLEADYPFMRVEEYALRRGSSGAGKHCGGLGARRVYRILDDGVTFNSYSDRFKIPPWGLFGGEPGAKSRFIIERGVEKVMLPSKGNTPLQRGDRLVIETAGGGGYGAPRDRDRGKIREDFEQGLAVPEGVAPPERA